ncbi:hypothetical protein LPLAFNJD_LOCUS1082 [Methylorubrum aminovorans]
MMSSPTLPFRVLRPGHHPDAPAGVINVRTHDRGIGLSELAASIEAHGLLQPLLVVAAPGKRTTKTLFYVADGNRRLAALASLVEGGRLDQDHAVKVIQTVGESAREFGLAANFHQVPMHVADRYAAFAALRDAGQSTAEIALRFGLTEASVRRVLALGSVAPMLLDAWRAGEFGEGKGAQELIAAFTVAPVADQERVYKALKKRGQVFLWEVRRELGTDGASRRWLTLVGREAYVAAGGVIHEDLFGDGDGVSDMPLLKRLADEKVTAECAKLTAAGWGWAATSDELPPGATYTWRQIPEGERQPTEAQAARIEELNALLNVESRDNDEETITAAEAEMAEIEATLAVPHTDADRARSGCIVGVDYSGQIVLREYVVRPDDAPTSPQAEAHASAPKPEPERGDISGTAMHVLTTALTAAVAEALPANPKAGLAALLAGALCRPGYSEPVRVRLEGVTGPAAGLKAKEGYAAVMQRLVDMSVDELLLVACEVAALGLDLRSDKGNAPPAARPAYRALAGAMDPGALAERIGERWDAAAFFGSVPKAVTLAAIEEALGPEEARWAKSLGKADLVARAVASVVPTGWLPREIRWPGYAGPGVEPSAAEIVALRPAA